MTKTTKMTVLSRNLLNCVRHESEDRRLWTFLHDCPTGKWHDTEKKPVYDGRDDFGRMWCEIEVSESYPDAETCLTAQRKNGFHSWKLVEQACEAYVFAPK